jgi:integrase
VTGYLIGRGHRVPIGTVRLQGVLDFLRIDAAGHSKPSDARVFSNEAGEPIQGFRTAWDAAVLRAHGHQPTRSAKDGKGRLTAECRDALRRIDLRWHDLRHEHASRLVELGVPLSQVRDLLGHASITTTERYDNQRPDALEAAVNRSNWSRFQESFKFRQFDGRSRHAAPGRRRRERIGSRRLGIWGG